MLVVSQAIHNSDGGRVRAGVCMSRSHLGILVGKVSDESNQKAAAAADPEACELLISPGSASAVKLMRNNNSELIAFGLSVNFNWPPEKCNCLFLLPSELRWQRDLN